MIFHLFLMLVGIALFFFEKNEPGVLQKKHIHKDKEANLVGRVLELIEGRMFHRIEEMRGKYCFECLL